MTEPGARRIECSAAVFLRSLHRVLRWFAVERKLYLLDKCFRLHPKPGIKRGLDELHTRQSRLCATGKNVPAAGHCGHMGSGSLMRPRAEQNHRRLQRIADDRHAGSPENFEKHRPLPVAALHNRFQLLKI